MATLTVKYSQLLTLSVMQQFYRNGICAAYTTAPKLDFTILPTDECLAFLKAKNMVFKSTDTTGGFTIMARTLGTNLSGNPLLKSRITNTDKLTFFMLLNNPNAVNFDLLPTQLAAGNIYYFSNQVVDNAALRTNLHLSKNKLGVDGNNDQVKKTDVNYKYSFAGVVTTAQAVVKHLLTGLTVNAASVIVQGTNSILTFNLSALPSGRCQLLISNVLIDTFYFLGTMASQPVFGVIELNLAATLPANYRIIETDQSLLPTRPNYTVLFKNRPTFWRYNIQLQTTSPIYLEMAKLTPAQKTDYINQLSITCNDASIKFKLASNTDLSFVFVSLAGIPLQEKYVLSSSATGAPLVFTLYKHITTNKTEVKSNLAYPSTGIINASNPPAIYSDIFISL
ncbi:hypothetical protein [Mucilaginibacter ginsenosidivorax]|uniref:Uncharacterized protein n=1 Tax=Mucilaginibacter ginsenosidivorax TaxID=862126 RepID=A0A5B8W1T2_9SPHI|nr:hypothetical protein [Mucilaginibacter ginsenosidivorax]QEC77990.1 hypothetical protein FSB76_19365 [Mucilaginibacter ginsenosidivorax]